MSNNMKVLFISDRNGYEAANPLCWLVEMDKISERILNALENGQRGVYHRGGNWEEIMKDGDINYTLLSSGRVSDFKNTDYNFKYKLISGNY